jgi:hypothetical protein
MKLSMWALSLAIVLAPVCLGQDAQMIWEGEVDGTSVLYIRGNRVDVMEKGGLPVQRQRFRFFDRLPDSRQNVELQVREGRGRVRIVEQPRLENNYTLAVEIDDRQGGSSFYSLELFWDTSRGGFAPGRGSPLGPVGGSFGGDSLTWSGRVDGEVVVVCRDRRCDPEVKSGQPVVRDRFRFSRPLPNRDVQVSLDETNGRGEIRLLQQPRRENDYTAQVLIRDHQGGSADYSFILSWTQPRRGAPESLFTRPGMYWSGRVDGKVRVIVEQRNARSEVIAGGPVTGERIRFEQTLPQRRGSEPQVRKLRGRGRVEVVEFPSPRNGYRLVFEIEDDKGGSDNYEIEAGW